MPNTVNVQILSFSSDQNLCIAKWCFYTALKHWRNIKEQLWKLMVKWEYNTGNHSLSKVRYIVVGYFCCCDCANMEQFTRFCLTQPCAKQLILNHFTEKQAKTLNAWDIITHPCLEVLCALRIIWFWLQPYIRWYPRDVNFWGSLYWF